MKRLWVACSATEDFRETYCQVGLYTAKLLKGANPAELPVQQIGGAAGGCL
jgi:hypothetical protein